MKQAHRGRGRFVCSWNNLRAVDAEAHAGVHGNPRAVLADNLFGFDVQTLSKFVWRCFAEPAFPGYVRRHLDWLAIRERLQAGIEVGGAS